MFGISFNELLIVLALALIVLGPDKLPELARSLGKGLGELKKATDDVTSSIMADTGLKETAESLKKSIMVDTGLQQTAEGIQKSLNAGMSREELRKMFEDIEGARPAQPPGGLSAKPEESSAEQPQPVTEPVTEAAADATAPAAPEAKPASVKPSKFADDDAD